MARGIATSGDVVTHALDGTPVETLWTEFQDTLDVWGQHMASLIGLLTFPTIAAAELIPQATAPEAFEEASEFGEPKSMRGADVASVAYDRRDYDTALRYTSRFLRDATAPEIQALHNQALASDQRLVFSKVLRPIFNNTARLNLDMTTPAGRAMARMLAVFAEFERDLISQRTRDAMAAKRRAGKHMGRPRLAPTEVVRRIVTARDSGASFGSIARGLTADAVLSPAGHRTWHESSVRRLYAAATKTRTEQASA